MPEADGYELTTKLRASGFSKPIIGVTAATVGEESAKLVEAGADSVLAKPLDIDKLTPLVQQLVMRQH